MGKSAKALAIVATVGTVILAAGSAAQAQPHPAKKPAQQCFRSSDWRGWKATPDAKTMYIETGVNRVWKFDLTQACPELNDLDAKLITRTRGSWTCSPMDVDMKVLRPGPGAFASYCQVKKITPLTPAQSKALPKELRP
jgi:hypothetical protein